MKIQDRMELLKILSETVQDVIRGGWMESVDFQEEDLRIRWQADGTGIVEQASASGGRGPELLRFQVEVTCSAVNQPAEVNEPTGFIVRKAWQYIPAGWFVRAKPSGPWYEVLETVRRGSMQAVTLQLTPTDSGTYPRDAEDVVDCRRGSLAPSSVQAALEALGEGVQILEDGA